MPSAAKRRKAAKKKKEQQALNNNNGDNSSSINDTHPQGSDDPKSQDERESDGGEIDSPASQDNQNQHRSFNGENEETEKRSASQDNLNELHSFNEENEESEKRVQSTFVSEDIPFDGVAGDAEGSQKTVEEDESNVKIERAMDFEQVIESIDVNVESVKKSHEGDDKSSSSSNSDDESQDSDKKWRAESHNSVVDASTCNNIEKVFPEEETQDSRIEKLLIEANGNSVTETAAAVDSVAPVVPVSDVGKCVMEGAQFPNPEVLDVVEPGLKEKEDKLQPKSSDVAACLVSEENEEKDLPLLDENVGASRMVNLSNLNGNEDKLLKSSSSQTAYEENVKDSETLDNTAIKNEGNILASSGEHTSEGSKGVDKARKLETSEYSETQPLVPSAPQIAQRTSWMSCCGLFDVLTGSS